MSNTNNKNVQTLCPIRTQNSTPTIYNCNLLYEFFPIWYEFFKMFRIFSKLCATHLELLKLLNDEQWHWA